MGGILSLQKAASCVSLFLKPTIFNTDQDDGNPADTG
jgi:hypothetical protein